jgi:hypothetical protein
MKGIVFLAREEAQERTALLRDVIADGAAKHGILRFECVKYRALSDRTIHVDLDLGADVCEGSQMARKHDANHGSV